jgi:DNA-directed RNA polymerase subunit beta
MADTYTERKRIRKNFGNRDSVLEIPYLLQMQKDAYTAFLQADVAPKKRTVEGLAQWICRDEVPGVQPRQAGVRRA